MSERLSRNRDPQHHVTAPGTDCRCAAYRSVVVQAPWR
jgi:hypothetical protein